MTREGAVEAWVRFRNEATAQADAEKQSQGALFALFECYRLLSPSDRDLIDVHLAQDLASGDELVRFDALAVIREFRIGGALPQLRALADRLEADDSPSAPYEWAKVNRLVGLLSEKPE